MKRKKPLSEIDIVRIIADLLENALCSLDDYRFCGTESLEKWFETGSIFCSVGKKITDQDYLQYIWGHEAEYDSVVISPSLTVFVTKDSKSTVGGGIVGFKLTNFGELAKVIQSVFEIPRTEKDKDLLQLLDSHSVKRMRSEEHPYPGEENEQS